MSKNVVLFEDGENITPTVNTIMGRYIYSDWDVEVRGLINEVCSYIYNELPKEDHNVNTINGIINSPLKNELTPGGNSNWSITGPDLNGNYCIDTVFPQKTAMSMITSAKINLASF
jgi:hypothetical protein